MSKAVLISIRPKWCELIASGEKTVEVRKTRPKLKPPFRCYIYCTKAAFPHEDFLVFDAGTNRVKAFYGGGKVIGEFVCDWCDPFEPTGTEYTELSLSSLVAPRELHEYSNNKPIYGWHISDLKIYDKPRELSEFERWQEPKEDIRPCQNGKQCQHIIYDYSEGCEACAIDFDGTDCPYYKVHRPPQSWCYVEEATE